MRLHCVRSALLAGVILSVAAGAVFAQAVGTATIQGRITDESAAGVPGATVTITSPALQVPQIVDVSQDSVSVGGLSGRHP